MDKEKIDNLDKNEDNKDPSNIIDKDENDKSENDNTKLSLDEENIELKDKLARAYAEMENQRRRFEKEKDEAFEYGGFSFAREALNLLDNLERSRISLQNDENLKDSEPLKKILEHIEIINKDMISIFKKNHIEEIKAINEKLDPNFHQAMMEVEDDSRDAGTIVQEIQKGFTMKDRLLRPSLVSVSKKKDTESEKSTENEEKYEKINLSKEVVVVKLALIWSL